MRGHPVLFAALLAGLVAAGCGQGLPYVENVPSPPKAKDSVAGGAAADPTYRLQPEDAFLVAVFDHPEASGPQTVGRDGLVAFPLVGPIMVQGKTATELREMLRKAYASFIRQPDVSVTVTAALGLKVFMLGEVAQPGVHSLAGGSRLTQAIVAAGGYTDHARTSKMVVIRETDKGIERIHLDIRDIVEGGHHEQDLPLQPGDMIHIPRKPYPVGWQEWLIVLNALNLIVSLSIATLTLTRK